MNLEYDFVISEETRRHFHRDGFAIVRNALTIGEVEILRREVDCLINFLISDDIDIMADYGGIIEPISCGYIDPPVSQMYILSKKSYSSLRNMVTEEPDTVVPVLFEKMPALVKHFLPAETADNPLCLFNEQYIVKTPSTPSTSSFKWHQDTGYMDASAQRTFPVVSCWTALDDVNITNGTLLIEPFPRPIDTATGEYLDIPSTLVGNNNSDIDSHLQHHVSLAHHYEQELDLETALAQSKVRASASLSSRRPTTDRLSRQQISYERQQPVLVDIPAGSIVFLSGFVRHCSLGNPSLKFRRAWMPQFSSGKVVVPESGTFVSMAVPCNGSSDLDQERERAQERASGYEGELDMDLEELDSFMD
ncbi:hypothetical protein EDD21DRAFT_389294 [Dissophora ornata]|nr:hypothetical protein EDD21DRAFT_389294 [Dissophora ornata]